MASNLIFITRIENKMISKINLCLLSTTVELPTLQKNANQQFNTDVITSTQESKTLGHIFMSTSTSILSYKQEISSFEPPI